MTIDAARFQKLLNDFKLEQPVLRRLLRQPPRKWVG